MVKMADHKPAFTPDRKNPFNRDRQSGGSQSADPGPNDEFGLFQDSLSHGSESGIPVIVCGTASSSNHRSLQAEGGSIFNRLLRPLTPSEATKTRMEPTRPRLVLRDADDDDDDDDDLLSPETANLLPQDSPNSSMIDVTESHIAEGEGRGVAAAIPESSMSSPRHCHPPVPYTREKTTAKIQLIVTSVLCFLFMMGEIAGGVFANSLALQTDAAHLASDLIAFLVSLFAIWASGKPATKRMSFGFHRIEVLGALFSIVMIWLLTGILVFMAVQRVINKDFDIDADAMIITAGCGVAFNIIMCGVLHADFCATDMGGLIKHGHSHGGNHGNNHGHSHGESRRQKHAHSDGVDREGRRWPFADRDVGNSVYHDLDSHGDAGQPHRRTSTPPRRDHPPDLVDNLPHSLNSDRHPRSPNDMSRISEAPVTPTRSSLVDIDSPPLPSAVFSPTIPQQVPPVSTVANKKNINVRAAIIHVIGDLIQSVGVLIAAYIIKYRKDDSYLIADPICTFVFSILVLGSTITVFRDVLTVLMEATPKDVDYNQLKFDLENIPGVKTAHSLHVWCLTLDKYAIAVHLAVSSSGKQMILEQASQMLQQKYGIHHTTIQVEDFAEEAMSSCSRCIGPQK